MLLLFSVSCAQRINMIYIINISPVLTIFWKEGLTWLTLLAFSLFLSIICSKRAQDREDFHNIHQFLSLSGWGGATKALVLNPTLFWT